MDSTKLNSADYFAAHIYEKVNSSTAKKGAQYQILHAKKDQTLHAKKGDQYPTVD